MLKLFLGNNFHGSVQIGAINGVFGKGVCPSLRETASFGVFCVKINASKLYSPVGKFAA